MRPSVTVVVLLAAVATLVAANSRKKRFLVFPTNSAMTVRTLAAQLISRPQLDLTKQLLQLSACLAKGGIVLQPPAFVFTFDFDLIFQLPNSTKVWTGLGPYKVLRREKRDLYMGMEELLERF